jgi:hypothetical protein
MFLILSIDTLASSRHRHQDQIPVPKTSGTTFKGSHTNNGIASADQRPYLLDWLT